MALSYESTRGGQKGVTASQAILKGLAEDGGLFMPTEIPKLDKTLEQLAGMTYQETAYEVMKLFLTDYTEEELKTCIANADPCTVFQVIVKNVGRRKSGWLHFAGCHIFDGV